MYTSMLPSMKNTDLKSDIYYIKIKTYSPNLLSVIGERERERERESFANSTIERTNSY